MTPMQARQGLMQIQAVSGLLLGTAVGVAIGRPDGKLIGGVIGALIGPIILATAGSAGFDTATAVQSGALSGPLHNPRFP